MRYECFLDSECSLDWILYISMTQFQVEHCNEAESLVAGIEACAGKGKTCFSHFSLVRLKLFSFNGQYAGTGEGEDAKNLTNLTQRKV